MLSKEEALKIKEIIFKGNKNKIESIKNVENVEEENPKKFTCSIKDLIVMATLSTSILAGLLIIFAFYSKIDDIVPKEFKRRVKPQLMMS